ncbi:hypothetical protein G7046_g2106 [Stylonectria norvegica]|nr:hypothetical protein G7046_g2106 [Stylonectria norvegica]
MPGSNPARQSADSRPAQQAPASAATKPVPASVAAIAARQAWEVVEEEEAPADRAAENGAAVISPPSAVEVVAFGLLMLIFRRGLVFIKGLLI